MRDKPLILVVDDKPDNRQILEARLGALDYMTETAADGQEAIELTTRLLPDLILLDVMMPKMNGFDVCRRLRSDKQLPFIPIVLVTARSEVTDLVTGLEAGANDYLTKPVDGAALTARVRSMLRIKALHDQVMAQQQELADWNRSLESKVEKQVDVIARANRLRRFLPGPIADQIVKSGDDNSLLVNHRAEIAVLFADLRDFTAYAESEEPETVMAALNAFHAYVGPLIEEYEGTLERFLGDGLVVLFNAPVKCADPAARAVRLALEIRSGFPTALNRYQRRDLRLGLGMGIAKGPAALGQIGFAGRLDYAAIGTVSNLAARLCDIAVDNQILVDKQVSEEVAEEFELSPMEPRQLKGFQQPTTFLQVI